MCSPFLIQVCSRSHNLRRATATLHVRCALFDLPHPTCHALFQSDRVGTLRALAPLPRTDDVQCQCLLHSPARVSPLLNLWLRIAAAWSAEWLPRGFIVVTPPVNLALHGGSGALSSIRSQLTLLRAESRQVNHSALSWVSGVAL